MYHTSDKSAPRVTTKQVYGGDKQWFEAVVLARKLVLSLCRTLPSRAPALQASLILAANFLYAMVTLYRPYAVEDFNRMETAAAVSTFACALMVCPPPHTPETPHSTH